MKTIPEFLAELNSKSQVLRFQAAKVEKRCIMFQSILNEDFYVKGGIINHTENYFKHINKTAKKCFGRKTEVHYNNTGSTFWIYV